MEDKKSVRKELLNLRDSQSFENWNKNSMTIERNIIKSSIYKKADCILCYSDFHGEVATDLLIEEALLSGKKIYLPKVLNNFIESRMDFYEIFSTSDLLKGFKGIKEPVGCYENAFSYEKFAFNNILMLVPGVAFSKDNYRLGYGKGYYDRYLSDKPNIFKCGLCFSLQIKDSLPVESNDIRMNYIISEKTSLEDINNFCKF